jgi:hypothetical protein
VRRASSAPALPAAAAVAASQAVVAAAYAAAHRPLGAAAAVACAVAWLLLTARARRAVFAMLFVALGLAAGAALAGAPSWLCAAAAGACVAAWDLSLLAADAPRAADPDQERRVMRAHLGALAAGLAPGIVLAGLLGGARITLPFGAVLALGVAALAALDRASRMLARGARPAATAAVEAPPSSRTAARRRPPRS